MLEEQSAWKPEAETKPHWNQFFIYRETQTTPPPHYNIVVIMVMNIIIIIIIIIILESMILWCMYWGAEHL
jgi:hypothetical protein